MSCDACGDGYKEKLRPMESWLEKAKIKAGETQQAQAICQEDSDGSRFIIDAATAFANRFRILKVVSGLPDISG